ncbi:hypothetical protein INT47_013090 [Mucor saturninus]|uniref:Uncharacterized protein n=1 Tax=Mucor saturninus TaxID=64648 RepID=A0A8H7R100_9FUNG|nr:hypothetical protein INT47_013090 [Mucor saturninus]
MLYQIAEDESMTRVNTEKSTSEVLLEVFHQTNLQFKKVLNVLEGMPESQTVKRVRAYADDGVLYTEACKTKYARRAVDSKDSMPPAPELSNSARTMMPERSSNADIFREGGDSLPKTFQN